MQVILVITSEESVTGRYIHMTEPNTETLCINSTKLKFPKNRYSKYKRATDQLTLHYKVITISDTMNELYCSTSSVYM